jgi:predicted RNA methylase
MPRHQQASRQSSRQSPERTSFHYEAEIFEGLESIVIEELRARFGVRISLRPAPRPDAIAFDYDGDLDDLLDLRSVVAVHLVGHFDVPRPKALLGHEHFERLIEMIQITRSLWSPRSFETFKVSAAGEDSSVMARLKTELEQRIGLRPDPDEGDLLLRIRRGRVGWEALVRLSPRPLATRPWRVCNLPGALNGAVAHAMLQLTQPRPDDRVLNIMCGSGTLLIERLALASAQNAIGCDIDPAALACAAENLNAASGHEIPEDEAERARLEGWDATDTPLADRCVDVICADLPFGQLIGSHRENEALYPRIFAEASRIAASRARMVLITHEVRLLEQVADQYRDVWRLDTVLRVRVGGMAPRVYLFIRY